MYGYNHHVYYQFRNLSNLKTLIELGADITSLNKNDEKVTPLELILLNCTNIDISEPAKVATILINLGATKTNRMKSTVQRIGETFEAYRSSFNKEFLAETEQGLEQLYNLFNIEPVAQLKVKVYDRASPITVIATTWQDQFNKLWDLLVPKSGHANTIQGEVIRITGKITREIYDNGAYNSNKDYKKLPQALPNYFSKGNTFDKEDLKEASKIAKRYKPTPIKKHSISSANMLLVGYY